MNWLPKKSWRLKAISKITVEIPEELLTFLREVSPKEGKTVDELIAKAVAFWRSEVWGPFLRKEED